MIFAFVTLRRHRQEAKFFAYAAQSTQATRAPDVSIISSRTRQGSRPGCSSAN